MEAIGQSFGLGWKASRMLRLVVSRYLTYPKKEARIGSRILAVVAWLPATGISAAADFALAAPPALGG